jgi:hypothetical protein
MEVIIELEIPINWCWRGYKVWFYTGLLPDIEFPICFYNRLVFYYKSIKKLATEFQEFNTK